MLHTWDFTKYLWGHKLNILNLLSNLDCLLEETIEFSSWKGTKFDLKSKYLPYLGHVENNSQNQHKIFHKISLKSWYQSSTKPFLDLLFQFLWTSISFHSCLFLSASLHPSVSNSVFLHLPLSLSQLPSLSPSSSFLSTPPLYAYTFKHSYPCATFYSNSTCLHANNSNNCWVFDLNLEWAFSSQAFPIIHLFTIKLWWLFVRIRRRHWIIYGWI